MKPRKLWSAMITVAVIVSMLLSISCKKKYHAPAYQPMPVTGVQLTMDARFGNILTDNNGRSLYFFFDDNGTTSNCTGGCNATWPVFYKENATIGTGLTASDFGVITRSDGAQQMTFKGWPLYYYAEDSQKGDVKGDGIGGNWAVAKADYTVMVAIGQLVGLDGQNYNDQGVAGTGPSTYITDPYGRTLYMFTRDTHNTNTFTKSDFSNDAVWPIDQVASVGSVPSVLDPSQFITIAVYGKTQLVFRGHPLYYFGQDAGKKGSTKGVSYPLPGSAIWKVVNKNTVVL